MLLGTTGTDALTPASDYDMLLVLNDLPAPIRIINTWVDTRLTEIYCTTFHAVSRIVDSNDPWPDGSEEGTVLVWLKEGRVVLDHEGRLTAAKGSASKAPLPSVAGRREIHEAWRKVGYNVAQIKRFLGAGDLVTRTIMEMRLLYSVAEVNLHYFTVRELPWRGEKPAIQYWTDHDPS